MSIPGISASVVENAGLFAEAFANATPFPHVVIDGFFEPSLCKRLIAAFPPFEGGCAINEHGARGGKATYEDVRALGAAFVDVDDAIRSDAFLALIGKITGIAGLMYDPQYVGGGTHENLPGQELDPHVDFNYHPVTGLHRRLNAIVYLNEKWDEAWGGAIELHKDPWNPELDETRSILPLRNRCVIFETSERSWHGFQAIKPPKDYLTLSRRSFAIYLYTTERPPEQTAPPHATVYVERPLPQLEVGEPLGFERAREIRRLVHRRVTHAKRLQSREEQQVELLAKFVDALTKRHAETFTDAQLKLLRELVVVQDSQLAALYAREKQLSDLRLRADELYGSLPPPSFPLLGSARVTRQVSGYWAADQWVGGTLRVPFRTTAPAHTTEVRGYLPEHAPGLTLRAEVASKTSERRLEPGNFTWTLPTELDAHQDAELVINAYPCWTPVSAGVGTDGRELSFVMNSVTVE